MGIFRKPKQPNYAKIQEEARLKEEARIAQEDAIKQQAQQEALAASEAKRKAFYQGVQGLSTDEEANKKFLKGA